MDEKNKHKELFHTKVRKRNDELHFVRDFLFLLFSVDLSKQKS